MRIFCFFKSRFWCFTWKLQGLWNPYSNHIWKSNIGFEKPYRKVAIDGHTLLNSIFSNKNIVLTGDAPKIYATEILYLSPVESAKQNRFAWVFFRTLKLNWSFYICTCACIWFTVVLIWSQGVSLSLQFHSVGIL